MIKVAQHILVFVIYVLWGKFFIVPMFFSAVDNPSILLNLLGFLAIICYLSLAIFYMVENFTKGVFHA